MKFTEDLIVQTTLEESEETYSLKNSFSLSFWLNAEKADANIISSGRINVSLNNAYLSSSIYVGSRWRNSEPFLIPLGSWIHLVLWWDGNKLRVYLNNEEATPSINANGNLTGSPTFYIGGDNLLNSEMFSGAIDDFRIYAHALNPKEREDAFNFISSALVATYGEEYFYQVETLKGPTDFNASGLPNGLLMDPGLGIIYGVPEEAGLDFNVTIHASNASGSDEENMTFFVNPGSQSILFKEINLATYGDPPIDINWTATSELPVELRIVEGLEFAELTEATAPSTLVLKSPGLVKLEGSQPGDGNQTYDAAPKVLDEFVISKKEIIVKVNNYFRRPDQSNPDFTYELVGLVGDDNESEFLEPILISATVTDGTTSSPTEEGKYPITASGARSDKYFFTYLDGSLTVSLKRKQKIDFEQEFTDVNALSLPITLTGNSLDEELNSTTDLALYYEIDDPEVARLSVTREDELISYWKLDDSRYAEALDQFRRNSGTLQNLVTTGNDSAWVDAKFSKGVKFDQNNSRIDFGPVRLDGNFTFSFWIKPNDGSSNGGRMTLLSKVGIPSMNHFSFIKRDGNGTVAIELHQDGNDSVTTLSAENIVLQDGNWTHFAFSYDATLPKISLFANGELLLESMEVEETINSLPYGFRFSQLSLGDNDSSFIGTFDDFRYYGISLSPMEIGRIYNSGGGDFNRMEIVGAGSTKITAFQQGNYLYESALPVSQNITVIKAEQTITFAELPDRSVGDFPFELTASSNSGLPVQFALSDLSLASLKDNFVTVRNAGTLTVTAYQEGNEKFLPAEEVTQSFSIRFGNLFSDSVPGMQLWLDATDINNDGKADHENDFISMDRISLWADKSGRNNSPVEANVTRMPRWNHEIINGKPAIEFSGTEGHSLALQISISDPTYIFMVAKQNQTGQSQIFGGDLFTTNEYGLFTLNYNSQNPFIPSSIPSTSWSVCVLGTQSNSQNLWVNGELMGSAASSLNPEAS